MIKRALQIGDYNTAAHGLWTLSALKLSAAVPKTNLVEVAGSSIPLDLSTALTDGVPVFGTRTLTATLESSEGDRPTREARISEMVNALSGYRVHITLPDDPDHYLSGRVTVTPQYNDLAHAAVQVSAVCDAWRYAAEETTVTVVPSKTAQTLTLTNRGRLPVVPKITIGGNVNLTFGAASWALADGTYQLPDLYLTPGDHEVTYSSSGGIVTFTYREAIL